MDKRRLIVFAQLPLIALWTVAFLIADCGDDGRLANATLRDSIYPTLRRVEGWYSDLRFRLRGSRPVQNKIVIVEIDDRAVGELGRWPWHRDAVAALVQLSVDAGAKVVGLDMWFPEPDQRVPDGVVELLTAHELGNEVPQFETDLMLQRIIDLAKDRLVLGWISDDYCQPRYSDHTACPVTEPGGLAGLPAGFEKFAYAQVRSARPLEVTTTPIVSAPSVSSNLPAYEQAASHAGFLVNAVDEYDNIVRRFQLAMVVGGHPQPALPLEMARIGLGDDLVLALDDDGHVERLGLARTGRDIPVDANGAMTINFRGAGYHFPFVGAIDLLAEEDVIAVKRGGKLERASRRELFADAYVLIGVSAHGAHDLRNFPFGTNIPGTEGLATTLDNILSGDALRRGGGGVFVVVLLLMTVGALLFGLAMVRLAALPAMLCALGVLGVLVLIDVAWLFARLDLAITSIFLIFELAAIAVVTVAVKYVLEERGKRFIRSTFSKYLAPAVVDQMLKDPSKLQLGGETRRLTIMMSDLRGFTAMAERMKPAEVVGVLNHYLGTMADIIMEHNGTIDEFIGDAILVIFGAPIERPDDARRAVACAIAMQHAMTDINAHNARHGLPRLEMGIAINSGEVIVGNIGSQKHIKYGVVGSHVNLTARIESNTVGSQVLISASTRELAGDDVKVGDKQLIVAKGFAEPIVAYDLRGIGGEYGRYLEEVELGLVDLATPIAVRYRVMKSKNEEGDEQHGELRAASALGALLVCEEPLAAATNLKLQVLAASGELVEGDLYAKVIGAGAPARLRFTSVPPAVERHLAPPPAPEPERSSELAERA